MNKLLPYTKQGIMQAYIMPVASGPASPVLAGPVFTIFFSLEHIIAKKKLSLMHDSGLIDHQHGSQ